MGDFLKGIHFKILLGVLILLLFFMLRAAWTGGFSPAVTQVMGAIVTPLQKVSSGISEAVSGYFERYTRADEISAENDALHQEINELRRQLVNYEQYRQENKTLKEYLEIKEENPDFELEPAAVVARDPNDRFYSFTIDKGSIHGVSPRDPVISPDGLVGVVKEVGVNYSKVMTILDVAVDVGAYDVRTRDIGIITGAVELAAEGKCKLTYLPRETGAASSDLIVTTGGGIFPKGLVIGTLSEIKNEGISLYAVVEPAADIRGLTDVMVIKAYQGQEAADEP